YGLGALATNDLAVKKIFEAKGRPSDNPLIVHVGTKEEVGIYIEHNSGVAKQCMDLFWPAPLTLVMPVKPNVLAKSVTEGLSTVGIRAADHPVA
ncbi:L-threonylcarbamoyladenylate synthase, partial [Lysinibacillus sp. D4B2_S17]|uniref:L-threonylcarbamoyladenylate synthase n=1 Tax=Lysinibacillus sp. D4B2_S17 TaxID=2941225 RepID=UPI0020BFE68F